MQKFRKYKRIIALVSLVVFISATSYADMTNYMSNVMSHVSNLTPQAYHAQQRGYFVGGTMHVPSLGQTIQPFSVTLPNIKNNSCGGINAMMGGFSYLNFDYLVKKLQGIIQAAPALAFEIGIKVLSEKLGNVSNVLETITDAMNNLNFNSCSAMNGIVTKSADFISNSISKSATVSSEKQSSGGSDWFGNAITDFADNTGKAITDWWDDLKGKVSASASTPDAIKQEVAGIPSTGLLNASATQIGGLPSDFVDMMRYYVGDVFPVQAQSTTGTPSPAGVAVLPCGINADAHNFVDDLIEGKIRTLTAAQLQNGDCQGHLETSASSSLEVQVQNDINLIYNNLVNYNSTSSLPPKAVNLIEMSPIPIYTFMRNAAILGNGLGSILGQQLAKPISIGIAANVAAMFIRTVMATSARAQLKTKIAGTEGSMESIQTYMHHLINFQNGLSSEYYNAKKDAETVYGNFMERYAKMQNEIDTWAKQIKMEQALRFQKTMGM